MGCEKLIEGWLIALQLLLYKDEKPSVRLSDCHVDISAMSASIETGLARNEGSIFV